MGCELNVMLTILFKLYFKQFKPLELQNVFLFKI